MIASRSPIVRLGIRAASPLAIVIAVYLLFAGHNRPGGGFAAGLVSVSYTHLRAHETAMNISYAVFGL